MGPCVDLNFRKLNFTKTEAVLFSSSCTKDTRETSLGPLSSYYRSVAKNLGVYINGTLKLSRRIHAVFQSGFFYLRQKLFSHLMCLIKLATCSSVPDWTIVILYMSAWISLLFTVFNYYVMPLPVCLPELTMRAHYTSLDVSSLA